MVAQAHTLLTSPTTRKKKKAINLQKPVDKNKNM
jgi:hypothetical protein